MSSEKPKGSNTGRIVTIIIIAALVGAVGFFAYSWYTEKTKNEEVEVTNDNLTAEIEDLEKDIEDYQLDLENNDLELEEKERLLTEKELKLDEKQKEIDRLLRDNKISRAQADRLSAKVEQMEYYIKRYQDEIEDLKEQVALLAEENDELKGQVSNMSSKVQNLTRQNEEKQFTIEVAKVLTAMNFSSYYVRSNGKKVMDNPIRKGRTDHIEICFDIVQNTAAEPGKKDIYLQITGPDGEVVKDNGVQSGYKDLDGSGKDSGYTSKKSIEYDRTTQKVCIDFKKPEDYDYEKGSYDVNVYSESFRIGGGSFEVK